MSTDENVRVHLTQTQEIEEVNKIFRDNLRMLRQSERLSINELAEKLGFNGRRMKSLDSGEVKPSFSEVILIVDYFPITFDDLLEYKIELHIQSRQKNDT